MTIAALVALAAGPAVLALPGGATIVAAPAGAGVRVVAPQIVTAGVGAVPGVALVTAAGRYGLSLSIDRGTIYAALDALQREIEALATTGVPTDAIGALQDQQGDLATAQAGLAATVDAIQASLDGIVAQAQAASAQAVAALDAAVSTNTAAVASAQADADHALAQLAAVATTVLSVQGALGAAQSSLSVQAAAIAGVNQALSGQITTVMAAIAANQASVTASLASLTTTTTALSTAQTALAATVAGNAATAAQGLTTELNARLALADSVTTLQASYDQSVGSYNATLSTLASQQAASTVAATALAAKVDDNAATATQQVAVEADARQTLAGSLTAFVNAYGQQVASYNGQIATLTNAQGSTATQLAALSASYGATAAAPSGGGNDLANSELNGLDNFTFNSSPAGAGSGLNLAGYYNPAGVNVAWSSIPGTPPAGSFADWHSPDMPATPGAVYEASVYAAYHRAAGFQLAIVYFDVSHARITDANAWVGGTSLGAGGGDLANFTQIGGFSTAPAGAAFRQLRFRLMANGVEANPYGFFTRPFSRTAPPSQTILSPYSPGTQANVGAINAAIASNATAAASATGAVAAQLNSLTAANAAQVASYNSQIGVLSQNGLVTAQQVAALTTQVGANSASVSQLFSSVNGLSAQYVLAVSLNGQTGGLELSGAQRADGTGAVFTLDIVANVTIHGDLLVSGTVSKGALTGATVGDLRAARTEVFFDGTSATGGSSGTFTVPAGVYWLTLQLWGAGGGSVDDPGNSAVRAGHSGAYVFAVIPVIPGQVISWVVGQGGAPGAGGGSTSFGNMVSATGGGVAGYGNPGSGSGGSFQRAGLVGGTFSYVESFSAYNGPLGPLAGAGAFGSAPSIGAAGSFPGGGAGAVATPGDTETDANGYPYFTRGPVQTFAGANGLIRVAY